MNTLFAQVSSDPDERQTTGLIICRSLGINARMDNLRSAVLRDPHGHHPLVFGVMFAFSLPLLVPACLLLDGSADLPQMPPEGV